MLVHQRKQQMGLKAYHHTWPNNVEFSTDTALEDVQGRSSSFPLFSSFHCASVATFLVAVAAYWNTVPGQFAFDDQEAIVYNGDVKGESPLYRLFQNDFWGTRIDLSTSHKSYRPLTILTFRLNYYLSGGFHPRGFHVTNVLIHGIVCILCLQVFSIILGGLQYDLISKQRIFTAPRLSLLGSFLFAVHPIHTESVAGVVGRAELLSAAFFFAAFLSYAKSCNVLFEYSTGEHTRPQKFSVKWLFLCILFSLLSMLCKEQGITVICVCIIYDIIVVCKVKIVSPLLQLEIFLHSLWSMILDKMNNNSRNQAGKRSTGTPLHTPTSTPKHSPKHSVQDKWRKSFFQRISLLLVSSVAMLFLRIQVMGTSLPQFEEWDNPPAFINNIIMRVINHIYIYAINCWLLINPSWLCFDWSMGCVPLIRHILDVRLFFVVIFSTACGGLIWVSISAINHRTGRLLVMSLAFLIIPFLPASNLFFTVGFVIAERVLYIPSFGFILLLILGIRKLFFCHEDWQQLPAAALQNNNVLELEQNDDFYGKQALSNEVVVSGTSRPKLSVMVQVCVLILLAAHTTRTLQRNMDWRSEELLFISGERVCPLNAKVHYNIGKVAGDAGNTEVAINRYRNAILLNPQYDQALNNLGNLLKDMGKEQEAEQLLKRAVELRPSFAAGWMNLGIIQTSLGKYEEAELSYIIALKHRRNYSDCYYNLGNLYLEKQQHQKALNAWTNATQLRPSHVNAWNNMIVMLEKNGSLQDAENIARKALRVLPEASSIHFHLGNILGKLEKYSEAEKHFLVAINADELNGNYWGNLGVLYHRWKRVDDAHRAYQRALELNPTLEQTQQNLVKLIRLIRESEDS